MLRRELICDAIDPVARLAAGQPRRLQAAPHLVDHLIGLLADSLRLREQGGDAPDTALRPRRQGLREVHGAAAPLLLRRAADVLGGGRGGSRGTRTHSPGGCGCTYRPRFPGYDLP